MSPLGAPISPSPEETTMTVSFLVLLWTYIYVAKYNYMHSKKILCCLMCAYSYKTYSKHLPATGLFGCSSVTRSLDIPPFTRQVPWMTLLCCHNKGTIGPLCQRVSSGGTEGRNARSEENEHLRFWQFESQTALWDGWKFTLQPWCRESSHPCQHVQTAMDCVCVCVLGAGGGGMVET